MLRGGGSGRGPGEPDGCAREANFGGCHDGDWFRDLAYSSN